MAASVLLHQPQSQQWLFFREPVEVIAVQDLEQVCPAIARLDQQVNQRGLYAAGFLSYEASPAFDAALTVQPRQPLGQDADAFPLLWFGLYETPQVVKDAELAELLGETASYELGDWQPSVTPREFDQAIAAIKAAIARGDTFQVNYTFRLRSRFQGSPAALFQSLMQAQPGNYSALIDTGRYVICSASPELFFTRQGDRLTTRPMKGTTERGRWWLSDRAQARALQRSAKNRAENVMIVDMLRNDLGRIAKLGSVQVPSLFETERYPTLWQMTSTVTAQSDASMLEVFRALFPCASITGAPKASTMGIIRALECSPRQIYTGAMGYWGPGPEAIAGTAQFNVAIRTVLLDREQQRAEYGVGSGIVWDSESGAEYEECCLKTAILSQPQPQFELLETLLWESASGYFLGEQHLERLEQSAEYFGFRFSRAAVEQALEALSLRLAQDQTAHSYRVRLLCDRQGQLQLQHFPWQFTPSPEPLKVGLSAQAIDSQHPLLYHKTTQRQIYEQARADCQDCDDVLLWNERGEVTESCIANVVVPWQGQLLTPPIASGLLAGTFRAWLLAQGKIEESIVTLDLLHQVPEFFLINSLRRWQRARLLSRRSAHPAWVDTSQSVAGLCEII